MRIIKKGVVPVRTKRGVCRRCETIVEYEPEDVTTSRQDIRDPYGTDRYWTCPVCKAGNGEK